MSLETTSTNRAIFNEAMRKQLGSQVIDDLTVEIEDLGGNYGVIIRKTGSERGIVANPYDPNWTEMPIGSFDEDPGDSEYFDLIPFTGRTLGELLEAVSHLIEQL